MTSFGGSVVLLGGPESGKTSFLGALWATVRDAPVGGAVFLRGHLPPKTQYLDAAQYALLACESVDRTKGGTAERVTLELSIDGHELALEHLDLAGESVETGLEMRRIGDTLAEHLAASECLLLFVHPEHVTGQQTVAQAERMLSASAGEAAPGGEEDDEEASPNVKVSVDPLVVWRAAPSSVHLVDLLQAVQRQRDGRPCQVALIVSAWDFVEQLPGATPTPTEWVKRELPLLHQYLNANKDACRWTAFGISAQGGDFRKEADVERLIEVPYPDRTIVESDAARSSDIADPLRWFIEGLM